MHGVLRSRLLPPQLPAACVPRTALVGRVLDRIDGRLVTIVAGAGYGKTTLLRTLATVQPPRGGRLAINGREVTSDAEARAARRQIGFLPQRFGFEPGMRGRDFVRYGAWLRGLPPGNWTDASRTALDHVGLLDEATMKMGSLSGGMRQRAAIAWAARWRWTSRSASDSCARPASPSPRDSGGRRCSDRAGRSARKLYHVRMFNRSGRAERLRFRAGPARL